MKKITILVVTVLLFCTKSNSQITKGNWMIGGSAAFTSTNNKSNATPNANQLLVQLSGDIGYFFFDKLAVGLKPAFESSTVKFFSGSNTSNILAVGPFTRYYFLPKEKIVNILVEVSYQYGIRWSTTNEILHSNRISISSGAVVFFNNSVGLEFTIGYSSLKYAKSNGLNNSVTAGIGFQFHLEKKEL